MKLVAMVLFVEGMPIGVLLRAVFDRQLGRRSRFWLRFVLVVVAISLPVLVALAAPLGEQIAGPLFVSGLVWGLLLLGPSWFVLFHRRGTDPGSGDDGGEGPGPGDGRPPPPAPIGGIPLPDAEPSLTRVRDHRPPPRARRPRRPVRERLPARLWLLNAGLALGFVKRGPGLTSYS